MGYAEIAHAHVLALAVFETQLLDLDPDGYLDWDRTSTDDYDNSIEFHDVPEDARLSGSQQTFIKSEGFGVCWLNHKDGWETMYYLYKDPIEMYRIDRNPKKVAECTGAD